jgi:hypothetical protein
MQREAKRARTRAHNITMRAKAFGRRLDANLKAIAYLAGVPLLLLALAGCFRPVGLGPCLPAGDDTAPQACGGWPVLAPGGHVQDACAALVSPDLRKAWGCAPLPPKPRLTGAELLLRIFSPQTFAAVEVGGQW